HPHRLPATPFEIFAPCRVTKDIDHGHVGRAAGLADLAGDPLQTAPAAAGEEQLGPFRAERAGGSGSNGAARAEDDSASVLQDGRLVHLLLNSVRWGSDRRDWRHPASTDGGWLRKWAHSLTSAAQGRATGRTIVTGLAWSAGLVPWSMADRMTRPAPSAPSHSTARATRASSEGRRRHARRRRGSAPLWHWRCSLRNGITSSATASG